MGVIDSVNNFRVVILGAHQTGKTALVVRYLTGRFIGDYASGMDTAYQHQEEIANQQVSLQILDTSEKKYSKAALAWADGVIVTYSIVDRSSLQKAKEILEEVEKINNRKVILFLVATKAELNQYRTVLRYEGELLAREYGATHFELSSFLDYKPVKRAFIKLVRKMMDRRIKNDKIVVTGKSPTMVFRKLLNKYEKRSSTI
ncbi:ras-related and estrogen-regulated growth inhibitor-like [Clytia hemisphaerica]|uniref:small monomeric GTPase n=1 Tax=Clytia hemisphaerica TaxID=252671 RepID=A0A7M5V1D6_9CNID